MLFTNFFASSVSFQFGFPMDFNFEEIRMFSNDTFFACSFLSLNGFFHPKLLNSAITTQKIDKILDHDHSGLSNAYTNFPPSEIYEF